MNCIETRDLLLQAESLAELQEPTIAHVRECAACGQLARDVERLEQEWRELPLPASADVAREAFLTQLAATR